MIKRVLRKKTPGLTVVAALVGVMLAACSTREVEQRELREDDRKSQVEVQDIVHQVRLALVVIHAYYQDTGHVAGTAGLALEKAVLTVNALHQDSGEGAIALLVPSGDAKEDVTASTTVKLTLSAPRGGDLQALLALPEHAAQQALITRLRELSQRACATATANTGATVTSTAPSADSAETAPGKTAPTPAATATDRALWESIAHVVIAGMDGYLCSLQRTGHAHMPLSEYEVTIAIGSRTTETEGLVISLGAWRLGSSSSQEADDVNTVVLTFSQN